MSFGLLYNTDINEQNTVSFDHTRWTKKKDIKKKESQTLKLNTQSCCYLNQRQKHLNVVCLLCWVNIGILDNAHKRTCWCLNVWVHVWAWNIDCWCPFIYFFVSSCAHWPLCNYLWDDWECCLTPDTLTLPTFLSYIHILMRRILIDLPHEESYLIYHCLMNCSTYVVLFLYILYLSLL